MPQKDLGQRCFINFPINQQSKWLVINLSCYKSTDSCLTCELLKLSTMFNKIRCNIFSDDQPLLKKARVDNPPNLPNSDNNHSDSDNQPPSSDNLPSDGDNEPSTSEDFDKLPEISEEELSYYQDLYPEMHNIDIESVPKVTVRSPGKLSGRLNALNCLIATFLLLLFIWQQAFNVSENAMGFLLSYMQYFFGQLAEIDPAFVGIATSFPGTVYLGKKMIDIGQQDTFKKFVVCPNPDCAELYDIKDCVKYVNGKPIPTKCTKSNYTGVRCGTSLLQANVVRNGGIYHVPKKVFCQKDIASQIQGILSRPGYEKYCQEWREREEVPDTYTDIYDGKIWKKVQRRGFFADDHDMGLMMNFDFFQPHKNRTKSVGVIYLALLNLPRSIRYNSNNMIVAGIIPSLDYLDEKGKTRHEPKSMNTFLRPIVDELKELWRVGKWINTYDHPNGIVMKAMLLGIACDSPASRKICGFLSHNAIKGCTRCLHEFKGKVGKKTYHGFDKHCWPKRTNESHRKHCCEISNAENKTQKEKLESQYGCRDSVLLELSYFDIIRQNVIDPMHNLFLGSAKSFFALLVEREILDDIKMAQMTQNLEKIYSNSSKSWLPKNIGSHWKYFNAYEWKQFTLVYSLQAFRGVISKQYLETWSIFVEACQLISKPCVTKTDLEAADLCFQNYIKALQKQFGRESIKPNQHMSCHLKECIEDFGPIYCFWLFAFERFNGFLGDYRTNNKGLEVTLMRKVLSDCSLASKTFDLPDSFFDSCSLPKSKVCISGKDELKTLSYEVKQLAQKPIEECRQLWCDLSIIKLPKSVTPTSKLNAKCLQAIDTDDLQLLHEMYSAMYQGCNIELHDLSSMARKCERLDFGSEKFSCRGNTESKLCLIFANWSDPVGKITPENTSIRLGVVKYFILHNVQIDGKAKSHILCSVDWYTDFTDSLPTGYLPPVKVFWKKKKICPGPASFMPVQRIMSKSAYSLREVNNYKDCIVASPVPFEIYF